MLREGGRTRRVDADVGCNCRDQSIWVFGGEEGGGKVIMFVRYGARRAPYDLDISIQISKYY